MNEPSGSGYVTGVLTLFYYKDLDAAAAWYVDKLGFERVRELEGAVILRIAGTSHLALIADGHGSQQPIPGRNKGAILSIETDALRSWYERLTALGLEGTGEGLQLGGSGRMREFKVYDPEGYTIEFFDWIEPPPER